MASLSTRIALTVTSILAIGGVVAGVAVQRALRDAEEAELGSHLQQRLGWLEGVLDIEMDDGEVDLDARDAPVGAAEAWQVADASGRVLWSGGPRGGVERPVERSTRKAFGAAQGELIAGAKLSHAAGIGRKKRASWELVKLDDVPDAARRAAVASFPDAVWVEAWQRVRVKKKDRDGPPQYELRGRTPETGRETDVVIDATGQVVEVKGREGGRYPAYVFAPGENLRLELVLTAWASAVETEAELARSARAIWTLGPLALGATAGLLVLAIRWQLRPLARMAHEASQIGPANVGGVVGPAGTSTELVRLRSALNLMLDRLAAALHRERRFAATAAHELRTPLAQMRLTLDVALRRERTPAEYREALTEMSDDVQRLERLVVGLLELTRATDGAAAAGRAVALQPVLARAAAVNGPATLVDDGGGVWVRGEPELLVAAVGNVIGNARRYAPAEPPTVRVEGDGNGRVRVVVADRGPGVPEADRERIFEPLTRLSTTNADGFGLGLAVARGAARAVGGDLTCRARADGQGGSEFVFDLPRAAAGEAEAAVTGAVGAPVNPGRR